MKNIDWDELYDMILECMDDGFDIFELSNKVKLINIICYFLFSMFKL